MTTRFRAPAHFLLAFLLSAISAWLVSTPAQAQTPAAQKPVQLSAAEIAAEQRRRKPADIRNSLAMPLAIESRAALIANARTGETLYGKNMHQHMPIASITKLMTAMVVLDSGADLNDPITITNEDVDHLRNTTSRLSVGTTLTRADMLLLALMASENRAASALARTYPGGLQAAITAMNRKARQLGMHDSRFRDGSGLNGDNQSTPADLVKMVQAAYRYPDIRAFSTMPEYQVHGKGGQLLQYRNTNSLVKKPEWDIGVSKTGFINEAGRCLVMMANINNTPTVIVLLDSFGKYTRIGDANRVKKWLELAYRS
ncbi:serine hydrolase [Perlucidibaca piscinae]|uniref:serine hydrolase n=1 Tax=Perlucidibaca piscinae TaxID=392589 RepID=UPI0003B45768|nr:serine hydrolase [Perlucidibaca piscinae]